MAVRTKIFAGLLAVAALTTACGKKDKEETAEAKCQSSREFFARQVWSSVMGKICIDCHGPGGLAESKGASFHLLPPGYPGFLDENFKAAEKIVATKYEGTPLMLLKPIGELGHGGGKVIDLGSPEYQALAELAAQLDTVDACPPAAAQTIQGAELAGPVATLRKAALQLVGRLPKPEETQAVVDGGDAALPAALDAFMTEPAFIERVKEMWNDVLLTDQFLSYSSYALNVLDDTDFPIANQIAYAASDPVRTSVNRAVAREPLDLIGYIVQNDRPFTEILTADFTVVNDESAAVFNISPAPAPLADGGTAPFAASALREGKIISLHGGAQVPWPHAGVLTSPMFLNRFPTTPTNRNRHRARYIYDIFLATNILKIAERPINPQESAKYINPTRDDPTCNQCHRQIDPVAGAFLRFSDYAQASFQPEHQWHPEMFAPGFGDQTMQVAEFDQAPAWLAQRITADPRFALAIVYNTYRALTGQDPLGYPEDPGSPGYDSRVTAWQIQDATLGAFASQFAANSYNLKGLVKAIVLSTYFRASGIASTASAEQRTELAEIGTARLSTPELLARKILATTGIPWSREWDLRDWLLTDYRILYGGIDSNIVTTRLTSPNGLMAAVQARLANEIACTATAWDFMQPKDQRFLFRHVEQTDVSATSDAVKKNIQYLHAQLLGEDLALDDPEIARTAQIFADTLTEGTGKLQGGTVNDWLPWACQGRRNPVTGVDVPDASRLNDDKGYVIRSWMAVITYLLSDYRFLYE